MNVTIDENAGFCFGVVKAIGTAEEELAKSATLYCLGDIVHNNAEVRRLNEKGLQVIEHNQLQSLGGRKVLIRAHGEPPATYRRAEALGIDLIDATCPIVLALQQKIRKGYEEMLASSPVGQVVIFGKPGHAEVIGLCGQTDNTAIVVSSPDDLGQIDFARPIRLYSQTTKSKEDYARLIKNIQARLGGAAAQAAEPESVVPASDFVAHDTICNRVANRATQLESFAREQDLVLFVSGKVSSNGHYLYEYCKHVQPNTHLVSDADEIDPAWLHGVSLAGITGATSTPRWLMDRIANEIRRMSATNNSVNP